MDASIGLPRFVYNLIARNIILSGGTFVFAIPR